MGLQNTGRVDRTKYFHYPMLSSDHLRPYSCLRAVGAQIPDGLANLDQKSSEEISPDAGHEKDRQGSDNLGTLGQISTLIQIAHKRIIGRIIIPFIFRHHGRPFGRFHPEQIGDHA